MRRAGAIFFFIVAAVFIATAIMETLPLANGFAPMVGVGVGQIVIGAVCVFIGRRLWQNKID